MKIRTHSGRANAFTLVEVILAVVIIGISAAGLMSCFTGSFFVMRMARENQRATQILIERAEALRVFSWSQITNGDVPATDTDHYSYISNNVPGPGPSYLVGVTIKNFPDSATTYQSYMYEVDINVKWTNSLDNVPRSRTLTTYVARDGIQNYVY